MTNILQRKGTIEIIIQLGDQNGQRHTDLRQELLVSSSTLQKRLIEGKNHGLWTQTLEDRGDIAVKLYQLTEIGQEIYTAALENGLDELHSTKRETVQEINEQERHLIEQFEQAMSETDLFHSEKE